MAQERGTDMKIALVGSGGGHLVQMREIRKHLKKYNVITVTMRGAGIDGNEEYALKNSDIVGLRYLYNFINAFKVLVKERPDIIITPGGGSIAIPFCIAGRSLLEWNRAGYDGAAKPQVWTRSRYLLEVLTIRCGLQLSIAGSRDWRCLKVAALSYCDEYGGMPDAGALQCS